MRRKPQAIYDHALDGSPIVRVELSNRPGQFAVFDAADWESWLTAERSPVIFMSGNGRGREYVCYAAPGTRGLLAPVARVLLGLQNGRLIRFADGVTTNLRRTNLLTIAGKSGGRKLGVPQPRKKAA